MDTLIPILAALLMAVLLAAGWVMTLLSLPGNWLIVIAVAVYALLVPNEWRVDVGWVVVGVVLVLAIVGEILEWLTVAAGTARAGGSRRAALLALGGSILGGLVGAVVGLPVPVVGSVIAIVLFAAVGATCGAMAGESWRGSSREASWAVGKAAFWGRLLGTLAKIGTACVIVVVVALALIG